jgi:hypothetical protein
MFWMLYSFFWVITRRLNFMCRHFETSAHKIQAPRESPKRKNTTNLNISMHTYERMYSITFGGVWGELMWWQEDISRNNVGTGPRHVGLCRWLWIKRISAVNFTISPDGIPPRLKIRSVNISYRQLPLPVFWSIITCTFFWEGLESLPTARNRLLLKPRLRWQKNIQVCLNERGKIWS